jgi:hypothetical protein
MIGAASAPPQAGHEDSAQGGGMARTLVHPRRSGVGDCRFSLEQKGAFFRGAKNDIGLDSPGDPASDAFAGRSALR